MRNAPMSRAARALGPVSLCAALALFGGGCKALGLTAPQAVTSEQVLADLEAKERTTGPSAPEIVALPPQPAPALLPPPPLAPAAAPAATVVPASRPALEDDQPIPATFAEEAPRPRAKTAKATPPATMGGRTHKVQRGETLQKISLKYYGTTTKWPKIYEANRAKIKKPDLIQVGMTIVIP